MSQASQKSQFDQLLKRNRGRLAAIAHAYADADADDLLQEILLQIWRGLASFESRSSIDTWCYRVALNTALTWRRTLGRKRNNLATEPADVSQLSGALDVHDHAELLQRFLRSLSDADRALLLLYMDEISGKEIAEITGLSEGAVRVRVHRIKQRLSRWSVSDV